MIDNTQGTKQIFNDEMLDYGTLLPMAGVRLEQPISVDAMIYISLNDKNGIYPGHLYELFYFNRGKWKSLGKKVATADYIEYDNVPSGHCIGCETTPRGKRNVRLR